MAGLSLEYVLNIPVPGVVTGLVLLFIALSSGLIKEEMIGETCDFLLSHLSFLFLPAGVGLITKTEIIKGNILPFAVIIIATTAIVWLVTAYTVRFFRRIFK